MSRKTKVKARSSSLFMLELIIAIVIFAVASSVCVQLFVKSHNLGKTSSCLNYMVNECSSIAEIISSSTDEASAISNLTDSMNYYRLFEQPDNKHFTSWRNGIYKTCSEDRAVYIIDVDITTQDGLISADISAKDSKSGDEIYSLNIKHAEGRQS